MFSSAQCIQTCSSPHAGSLDACRESVPCSSGNQQATLPQFGQSRRGTDCFLTDSQRSEAEGFPVAWVLLYSRNGEERGRRAMGARPHARISFRGGARFFPPSTPNSVLAVTFSIAGGRSDAVPSTTARRSRVGRRPI